MCKALLFGVRVNAHLHHHESQASQLHSDVEHFGLACASCSFNHPLQGQHNEALTSPLLVYFCHFVTLDMQYMLHRSNIGYNDIQWQGRVQQGYKAVPACGIGTMQCNLHAKTSKNSAFFFAAQAHSQNRLHTFCSALIPDLWLLQNLNHSQMVRNAAHLAQTLACKPSKVVVGVLRAPSGRNLATASGKALEVGHAASDTMCTKKVKCTSAVQSPLKLKKKMI